MKIKNLMSIGACCTSLFFMKNLNLRIPGPVDNLRGDNLSSCIKLLNGDFYNSIINNTYYFLDEKWEDIDICQFSGFQMIHNNFHLDKTKIEIIKRYNNLLKYLEEAKNNKEMFFVISYRDIDRDYLNNETISYILNNLPEYIKCRLIVILETEIGGQYPEDFPDVGYYTKFYTTCDIMRGDTVILKEQFNNWWKLNKINYEIQNKCKYDLL